MQVYLLPAPPGLEPFVKAVSVRRRATAVDRAVRAVSAQNFAANAYAVLTFCHQGAMWDPAQDRRLQPVEITGATTGPVWRTYDEAPEVTTVFLQPGAAQRLFRTDAQVLTDRSLDATSLLPPGEALAVCEQLAELNSTAAQLLCVERFLYRLCAPVLEEKHDSAPLKLPAHAHLLSVAELAQSLEIGPRQLHRRMLAQLGLAPKQWLRVQRVQQCLRELRVAATNRENPAPWPALAARLGYADRSHLRRDFLALVGSLPAAVLSDWAEPHPHYWDFEPSPA